MASLIPYDPLVDTGIDELFRGFFQPDSHGRQGSPGDDQDGRHRR